MPPEADDAPAELDDDELDDDELDDDELDDDEDWPGGLLGWEGCGLEGCGNGELPDRPGGGPLNQEPYMGVLGIGTRGRLTNGEDESR